MSMKQVTIDNVKKRILELERAGCQGLAISLNEERELDCLRQLVAVTEQLHAVVAENAALKISEIEHDNTCREVYGDEWVSLTMETPATDAFLASLRAEGVDMAIQHLHSKFEGTGNIGVPVMSLEWLAAQLRSQSEQVKGVQS